MDEEDLKELNEIIETDLEKRVKIEIPFESLVLFSTALGHYREFILDQTSVGNIEEGIRDIMLERVDSSVEFLIKVMMEEGDELYEKLSEFSLLALLRNPENTTFQ